MSKSLKLMRRSLATSAQIWYSSKCSFKYWLWAHSDSCRLNTLYRLRAVLSSSCRATVKSLSSVHSSLQWQSYLLNANCTCRVGKIQPSRTHCELWQMTSHILELAIWLQTMQRNLLISNLPAAFRSLNEESCKPRLQRVWIERLANDSEAIPRIVYGRESRHSYLWKSVV